MSRPDFGTIGSTVAACEGVVKYLIPYLQADAVGGDKQVDRVQTVERHIGQFDKPEDVKRWLSNRDGGVRVAADARRLRRARVPKPLRHGGHGEDFQPFNAYQG